MVDRDNYLEKGARRIEAADVFLKRHVYPLVRQGTPITSENLKEALGSFKVEYPQAEIFPHLIFFGAYRTGRLLTAIQLAEPVIELIEEGATQEESYDLKTAELDIQAIQLLTQACRKLLSG